MGLIPDLGTSAFHEHGQKKKKRYFFLTNRKYFHQAKTNNFCGVSENVVLNEKLKQRKKCAKGNSIGPSKSRGLASRSGARTMSI